MRLPKQDSMAGVSMLRAVGRLGTNTMMFWSLSAPELLLQTGMSACFSPVCHHICASHSCSLWDESSLMSDGPHGNWVHTKPKADGYLSGRIT